MICASYWGPVAWVPIRRPPHDIANLVVSDGSVLPTPGLRKPGFTVQSLAALTADYLISQGERIFNSNERDMTPPASRRELAPPDTWGHGVPRLG